MVSQGARVRGTLTHFLENKFLLKNEMLHISCSNIRYYMLYQCCENVIFRKLNIWGLDFFRLKVPQSPLQLVGPQGG